MKPIIKQTNKKAAFTIVELLVVMSIIIILIGLIVPSLNVARRYTKRVAQKAQFHSIKNAMELFSNEFDGYPRSDAEDENNEHYCGAMKLCEAMMGQDLLGFHPDSHFRNDLTTGGTSPVLLYDKDPGPVDDPDDDNLRTRKGPYLPLENANAYRMKNLYSNTGKFDGDRFVLCDAYTRQMLTGEKTGMPVLYYRADTSGTQHPHFEDDAFIGQLPTPGDTQGNFYNYLDNDELVKLAMPWAGGAPHPMENPEIFYDTEERHDRTFNPRITIQTGRPHRSDSYILLSAGFDGQYGTSDDVFNFGD